MKDIQLHLGEIKTEAPSGIADELSRRGWMKTEYGNGGWVSPYTGRVSYWVQAIQIELDKGHDIHP